MDTQLRELLTGYGDIGGIWFDGWWDKPDADWRLDRTYRLIHSLQPAALVGNNHHRLPFPGEDFQMFEKDLPGHKTADFNTTSEVGKLPLETCDTINNSWGYNKNDKHFKSTAQLIQYLARAAGYNANFLLNIGPMPDRENTARVCRAPARHRPVGRSQRRIDLRHPRRASPPNLLGRDDAAARQNLRPRDGLQRRPAGPFPVAGREGRQGARIGRAGRSQFRQRRNRTPAARHPR